MKVFEEIYDYLPEEMRNLPFVESGFYIQRFSDFDIESEKIYEKYQTAHKRNFFEITLAIKESININIGGTSYCGTKNFLELVSPFQLFSIDSTPLLKEKEAAEYDETYTILFKPCFFKPARQAYEIQNEFPFFNIHTTPRYQLSAKEMSELSPIIEAMYIEAKHPKTYSYQILESYFKILLYMIKQIAQSEVKNISNNRFDTVTSKFEQIISINGSNFTSVAQYASQLNISSIYLSECVKKSTGKSAQQVLIDYKTLYIKSLLHQTDKPISEIAMEIGFSEVTNFTKFFKRNTGLTPNQFRKQEK